MFASNFPVDKISCGYTEMWNAFKIVTKARTDEEKDCLFHDTAKKVYKLGK